MPRVNVPATALPGGYKGSGNVLTFTAANTVDKNSFIATNKDLVVVHNTGAAPATVTFNSVADQFNRTGDIAAESIDAGAMKIFGPFLQVGWAQLATGVIHLEASAADVKFAVIKLDS
jgi:hypothetical protein